MSYQYNVFDELIVDHFCGGGGASTGIELALGRIVDIAVNHDLAAIGMHEQNHPYTKHYHKDVFEVDPAEATGGRPVGLMWLSPDCTHFSKAKGGTPVKKEIRGLAWLAVKWASAVKPRVIMLENVPEFLTWCPLTADNRPDKTKQRKITRTIDGRKIKETHGTTFTKFVAALNALSYVVDWRVLSADEYGAATTRQRLYLVARCDGRPIVFPRPTHGEADGLKPREAAYKHIDFNLRGKSIFDRKKPLADATLNRIAKGLVKFTIKNPRPFIVQVNHAGEFRGQELDKPLPTITQKGNLGIIQTELTPFVMCNNNNNIGSAADDPLHTITGGNRHYLTESALAPFISSRYGDNGASNVRGAAVDKPLRTITAKDHNDLVAVHIDKCFSGGYKGAGSAADKPIGTITAVDHNRIVETHLCVLRRNCDCVSVENPLPTITAAGGHFAEIKTYLTKYAASAPLGHWDAVRLLLNTHAGYNIAPNEILIIEIDGTPYFISDIEMRMLASKELYGCQGFPSDYNFTHAKINGKTVALTQTEQTRKVGNSVCPPVPRALVAANLPEYRVKKPIETMKEFLTEVCA